MDLQTACAKKESQEPVAVFFPGGGHRLSTKVGVIVDIKEKLRTGRIYRYATIRWSRPTSRGASATDVFIGRVRSIASVREGV